MAALGTRALGMGGAFVAVADDASAVYWNPAGLAAGPVLDLTIEHQQGEQLRDGRGLPATSSGRGALGRAFNFALATPAAGITYYRLRTVSLPARGFEDRARSPDVAVQNLYTQHFGVTLLQSLAEGITLGTTVKLVRGTAVVSALASDDTIGNVLEGAGGDGRTTTRFDLDAGLHVVRGSVRFGVVARNVRQPEFETSGTLADPPERVRLSRHYRAGVAYAPRVGTAGPQGPWTLAADFDLNRYDTVFGPRRDLAVGGEGWWFGGYVGARAGIRFNTLMDEGQGREPVVAFGVSVSPGEDAVVEGQLTRGGDYLEKNWGVSVRLTF